IARSAMTAPQFRSAVSGSLEHFASGTCRRTRNAPCRPQLFRSGRFLRYLKRFVEISRRSAYDPSRDDSPSAPSPSNDPGRDPWSRLAGVAGDAVTCPTGRRNLFLRKQLALYMEWRGIVPRLDRGSGGRFVRPVI